MFMNKRDKSKAFTLIELLTVIAIIGILAGIIIPTVGSVKTSANKSKTKVQFSQWAASVELFKQDYGFYPTLSTAVGSGLIDTPNFAAALTGRDITGAKLASGSLNGNKKGASYYSIADSELAGSSTSAVLVDAFRNQQIMVLIDVDNDGFIKAGELKSQTLGVGNVADDTQVTTTGAQSPSSDYFPTAGIRAGVAFYSGGKEAKTNDYVYSWSVK
jgi:prepilin-type N-terminal cleavage/methylation domain-containing protein